MNALKKCELSKAQMEVLALDSVSYAEICRLAFPNEKYKNPSQVIQKIIGRKKDLKTGPILKSFDELPKDIPEEDIADEEKHTAYQRTNWIEHYNTIGVMLSKGQPYKNIYFKIIGQQGTGASLNNHINIKFGSKDRFLIWWAAEEEKEDEERSKELEKEYELKFNEKLKQEKEKIQHKYDSLKKENMTLKVIVELCKQKMTDKKILELEKIANLLVNNFKDYSNASIDNIKSVVSALESYITTPLSVNVKENI